METKKINKKYIIILCCAFFLFVWLLGRHDAKPASTETVTSSDTSYYFIKRLFNASPSEAEVILGKPDTKITTDECYDDEFKNLRCKEAEYQNGKYTIEYYNDHLKYLSFQVSNKNYNENFCDELNIGGYPNFTSTLADGMKSMFWRRWNNGIKEIQILSKDGDIAHVGLCNIQLKKGYDKKFTIEPQTAVANARIASQSQSKSIDGQIAQQFVGFTHRSNKYLDEVIKSKLNVPGSYEVIQTSSQDLLDKDGVDYLVVKTEFNAQNLFGVKLQYRASGHVYLDGTVTHFEMYKY